MPSIGLLGQVPAEHLDVAGAALAGHRRDRADQCRFAGRVKRRHVRIGGHQVFRGAQRHLLHVLAVDRVEEGDVQAAVSDRLLEAVEALVLDEGIEGADHADLGSATHLGS